MPIKKYDEHYKISFEFEFGFDPDDIISIVDHVMTDTEVSPHYIVEVVQCNSGDVVHSFEIYDGIDKNIIACSGRILPKDCYDLHVTILEDDNAQNLNYPGEDSNPLQAVLLILPLLLLIGYTGYTARKKGSMAMDPHISVIGSTQFDQKNMTLTHEGKEEELSHKEAQLLAVFLASANEPVKREEILQKVWGDDGDYVGRTLDVFVSKLRKKLDADMTIKIMNIRGVGYKLVVNS